MSTDPSAKFTADYGWATAYALGQGREAKTFIGNVIDNNHKYSWDTYRDLWNNEFGRKVGQLYNDGKIDKGQIYTVIDIGIKDGSLIKYSNDARISALN